MLMVAYTNLPILIELEGNELSKSIWENVLLFESWLKSLQSHHCIVCVMRFGSLGMLRVVLFIFLIGRYVTVVN